MKILLLICLLLTSALQLFANPAGTFGFQKYNGDEYASSVLLYRKAALEAARNANSRKEVIYLNNLASAFFALGQKDSAQHYLTESRQACFGDSLLLVVPDLNSAFFGHHTDYALSEDKLTKLKAYFSPYEFGNLLLAYGRWLMTKNESAPAQACFKQAGAIFEESTNSVGYAYSVLYLARTYLLSGELDKTKSDTDKALALFQKGPYRRGIRETLLIRKALFEKMGDPAAVKKTESLLKRVP